MLVISNWNLPLPMVHTAMACVIRIVFAAKKVPHPEIITFEEKVINLEPEISPYFSKTNYLPADTKSRPLLQQKLTRLSQLYSDYSNLTSRTKRIHYLKKLLQEKDVHGSMPGNQESDSEGSSVENLGDATQFGLTGALAQMANLTFMAGAPELIQDVAYRASASGTSGSTMNDEQRKGLAMETPVVRGLTHVNNKPSDGGETSGESIQVPQTRIQVEADDENQESDDETGMLAAAATRGRRSAVTVPIPSQKRKSN